MSLSASSQVGNVIEQAMRDILGHAASTVFFKELERKMDVRPLDIAKNKTEPFSALLRQVFGRGGDSIENSIVLRLADEFDVERKAFPQMIVEILKSQAEVSA